MVKILCGLTFFILLSTGQLPAAAAPCQGPAKQDTLIQFIFCSDVHFGITRKNFRGANKVSSLEVNDAMVDAMNKLDGETLPEDKGVNAGKQVRNIQALVITGDIANREEEGVQAASISWKQFEQEYEQKFHAGNENGQQPQLLVTTGNHDVSDAVGFHRPMEPQTDPSSVIGIYNLEMNPKRKLTKKKFHYQKDIVHYSRNIGPLHFVFINLWPDSAERIWMEKDLATVPDSVPVFIFTHSMPDVEARFFINPNGDHSINATDKFENLVTETFKDGDSVNTVALQEQTELENFIKIHPNIKGYFHGHTNYTEFYTWTGPHHTISLPCYRVDSPMKGKYSGKDETKLSFQLVSINTSTGEITARECLWNAEPMNPAHPISWGKSVTSHL